MSFSTFTSTPCTEPKKKNSVVLFLKGHITFSSTRVPFVASHAPRCFVLPHVSKKSVYFSFFHYSHSHGEVKGKIITRV